MTSADSLNRRGAELYTEGDLEGARLHYVAALQVDPGFVPAMANLGVVLSQQDKLLAAETWLSRVVHLVPDDGNQWNNYGNVLMRLERYAESKVALEHGASLVPDNAASWHNLALLYHRTDEQEKALECLDRAIALGADTAQIRNDRAHVLLSQGRSLHEALVEYEARWHTLIHLEPWDFHISEWQGQGLEGKRILLHGEQGFGDTVMSSRFARDLQARGGRVTLGLPPALCTLFQDQFPEVEVLDISKMTEEDAQDFDFQSPMYGAMRWLEVEWENIDPRPYLRAPEITVPAVHRVVFNIGICWGSGIRGNELDWRRRHAPLQHWLQLAMPGVQLWSLQKDAENLEIQRLGAECLVEDRSRAFDSWAETAAFIAQLDLVISVDTAVVHIAGAMGKPVWMLAQFVPCWRWWNIENGDGWPWYENFRIYRQNSPGDWKGQLNEIRNDLRIILADRASSSPLTDRGLAA